MQYIQESSESLSCNLTNLSLVHKCLVECLRSILLFHVIIVGITPRLLPIHVFL